MKTSSRTPLSRTYARAFGLLTFVLALSGMAQMPIFKRYYIADLPGLGWLADYYLTHKLHYVAAILFMALIGYLAARWLRQWSRGLRLTRSGWLRVALVLGIVLTGALRMYKNQPGVSYDPFTTMLVDWTHLGLVMLLGLSALALRILGKRAYARERGAPSST
ncbi:MAG: FeS-binding protein [Desulfovibrio sp.]